MQLYKYWLLGKFTNITYYVATKVNFPRQNQTQTSILDRPFNFQVFCYSNVDFVKHATVKLQHTFNTGILDNSSNLLETYQSLAVRQYAPQRISLVTTNGNVVQPFNSLPTRATRSLELFTHLESGVISFVSQLLGYAVLCIRMCDTYVFC